MSIGSGGRRSKGRKGRKSGGVVGAEFSSYGPCGPSASSIVGRSYGALSNAGTYSAASLGVCDDTIFLERYTPASGVVGDAGQELEDSHQVGFHPNDILLHFDALYDYGITFKFLHSRVNILNFRIRRRPFQLVFDPESFTLHRLDPHWPRLHRPAFIQR